MRTLVKIIIALILIGVYWAFGGFDPVRERYLRKLQGAIFAVYVSGVLCALVEGDEEHVFHRGYSLRPIFILVGSILMIAAFCAMLATKADRRKRVMDAEPAESQAVTKPPESSARGGMP